MLEEILQECSYDTGRGDYLIHRTLRTFTVFVDHMMFGWGYFEIMDETEERFRDMFEIAGQRMSENALYWGLLFKEYTKYAYVERCDNETF